MASSRFSDTWLTVRQKMSFHPFQGIRAGEAASRPRPGSRVRANSHVRGSSRDGWPPNGGNGRGGGSVFSAATARAPATISSEVKKAGCVWAYGIFGKSFLKG